MSACAPALLSRASRCAAVALTLLFNFATGAFAQTRAHFTTADAISPALAMSAPAPTIDPATDETPQVSTVRTNPLVGISEIVVVDTFLVHNPGTQTAQYLVRTGCNYGTLPTPPDCVSSLSPSTITVAAGATARVPVTYSVPTPAGVQMLVRVSATLLSVSGSELGSNYVDLIPTTSNDAAAHVPEVSTARTHPHVGINQTVVDTFLVHNPGSHAVKYLLGTGCNFGSVPSPPDCVSSLSPTTITVGAGATARVPVTYPTPPLAGYDMLVRVGASLLNASGEVIASGTHADLTPTTAELNPFIVTSANASVSDPLEEDPYLRLGTIGFYVVNNSSQTRDFVADGDCGPMWDEQGQCADPVITGNMGTLGPGQGTWIYQYIHVGTWQDGSGSGNITMRIYPPGGPVGPTWSVHVTWNSVTHALSAQYVPTTYTPVFAQHTGSGTTNPNQFNSTPQVTFQNAGSVMATYTVTAECSGQVYSCSPYPATFNNLASGGSGFASASYHTTSVIGTGTVRVIVTAPPRPTGLVEADTFTYTVTIPDAIAPTIALSPAGDPDGGGGFQTLGITSNVLTLTVCDPDGVIGTPMLMVGSTAVSAQSVTSISQSGCNTAKTATYVVPFAPGHNVVVASVSDGGHTVSVTQPYEYNDAQAHAAHIVPAHASPTAPLGRAVTDTFYLTNPGWHTATYSMWPGCTYNTGDTYQVCPTPTVNGGTPTVTVAAGATATIPIVYQSPATEGWTTKFDLWASFTSGGSTGNGMGTFTSTAAAPLPPVVTITPANGTAVTTGTIALVIRACDPDDGFSNFVFTWQGQAITNTSNSATTPAVGCREFTWNSLGINPGPQTLTATVTDEHNHVTTASSTITYNAPPSVFRPSVTPPAPHSILRFASKADTFTVRNVGQYQATYALTAPCNTLVNCSVSPSSVTLFPNGVAFPIVTYTTNAGSNMRDTLRLVATNTSPMGTIADTGRVPFLEATFTPVLSPHASTPVVPSNSQIPVSFILTNTGNAPATYTVTPQCTGNLSGCTAPYTVSLNPAASTSVGVTTTTGAPTGFAVSKLVVRAPARESGLIDADSATATYDIRDLLAPSVTVSMPAYGPIESGSGPIGLGTRAAITVDACDQDGSLLNPQLQLNGVSVAPTSVTNLTQVNCFTAKRAVFNPAFPPGTSSVSITVTDQWHDVHWSNDIVYDDSYDHRATIVPVHATPQVPINRTVTDTFHVTNPGWHAATYTLTPGCAYMTNNNVNPSCPAASASQTSVTLNAGATANVAVTYTTPSSRDRLGWDILVSLTAVSSVTGDGRTSQGTFVAHTAPLLPPAITFAPSLGSTVTTSTIDLTITWCDEDDNILHRTATWQGQPLSIPVPNGVVTGCIQQTWAELPINPWTQTVSATASDEQGHTTTQTGTITYMAPITVFRPDVTPAFSTRRKLPNVAAQDTFFVKNVGQYPGLYTLARSCGTLSGCAISASSVTVNPGDSAAVYVSYTSSSAHDARDSVRVIATYTSPFGATIADTGIVVSTVPSAEVAPVITPTGNLVYIQPGHWIRLMWVTVTNNSSVPITYALNQTKSPGGFDVADLIGYDYQPLHSLTIDPGQSADALFYITSPLTVDNVATVSVTASYVTSAGVTLSATSVQTFKSRYDVNSYEFIPRTQAYTEPRNPFVKRKAVAIKNTGNTILELHTTIECPPQMQCVRDGDSANPDAEVPIDGTVGVGIAYYLDALPMGVIRVIANGNGVIDTATIVIRSDQKFAQASVTPHSVGPILVGTGLVYPQKFFVKNVGDTTGVIHYAVTCTGDAIATCPTLTSNSRTLDAQKIDTLTLNTGFTTQLGKTGSVKLLAWVGTGTDSLDDSGTATFNTATVAQIVVNTRGVNPGTTIAKDQCLSLAAGAGAAYECGELRLTMPFPTTTTMNTPHTPGLIYNSEHAAPRALVQANVTVQPTTRVDSIRATMQIGSNSWPAGSWKWNASLGTTQRIAVNVDAVARSLVTGLYQYTLQVIPVDSTGHAMDPVIRIDTLVIVDRTVSPYGRGWWLSGYEKLITPGDTSARLWIGDDGSTRLYRRRTATIWTVADSLADRPDTLEKVDTTYRRHLGGGAFVEFDSYLRHTRTVDAHGLAVTFTRHADITDAVAAITLPIPAGAGGPTYQINYHEGSTNLFWFVDAPSVSGQLRRSGDGYYADRSMSAFSYSDTTSIWFTYANGYVASRVSPLGDTTTFAYDEAHKLKSATSSFSRTGDGSATVQFCAAESRPIATCALPVSPDRVLYTAVDGPRSDADTTHFFINRFGGADTVFDALGHRTSVVRNALFPMLADTVTAPNGLRTGTTYNSSGLPVSVTTFGPYNDGRNPTVTYHWDLKWNLPDTVTSAMGINTISKYDATSGDPLFQQVGPDSARRVRYHYFSDSHLLQSVTPPAPLGATTYTYDGLGNSSAATDPRGLTTTTTRDGIGRPTFVTTPIDSLGTQLRYQRYQYDIDSRVTAAVDSARTSVSDGTMQFVQVFTAYDKEGKVTGVTRRMGASTSNDIVTSATYDAAGRITGRFDPGKGSLPIVSWTYPTGFRSVITTTASVGTDTVITDVLGQQVHRGISAAASDPTTADAQNFYYDMMGNLDSATNKYAKVGRTYFANGALRTETQRIAKADLTFGNDALSHVYTLSYTYDSDGKRTTMTRPSNLGLFSTTTYGYDNTTTGELTTVSVPELPRPFRYFTAATGMLDSLVRPDSSVERYTYRSNASPVTRQDGSPSSATAYHNDAFKFDGRGKTLRMNASTFGSATTLDFSYAGLGGVLSAPGPQSESYTRDPLGSVLTRHVDATVGGWSGDFANTYEASSTRLSRIVGSEGQNTTDSLTVTYDQAGNVVQRVQRIHYLLPCPDHQAMCDPQYALAWSTLTHGYAGDGRLRASELTTSNDNLAQIDTTQVAPYGAVGRGVYEQYRYDALGRRVWRRAFRDNYCSNSNPSVDPICLGVIERTVYDGDQVLYEIRQPGNASESASVLEADNAPATMFPNQFGMVAYLQGTGVDQPLAVSRLRDGSATTVVLHRDWQGAVDFARLLDGHSIDCGRPDASNGCEHIPWPGLDQSVGFQRPVSDVGQFAWWGTLVSGNQNATGTIDMRARQFDPRTGVFMQEDPFGIVGGLDTYGFGGGDAVNLLDPDGTCPGGFIANPDTRGNGKVWCVPPAVLNPVVVEARSPFFDAMRGLQGILNGVGELSGINGFGRGADQMGGGSVARGALTMALSMPFVPGEGEAAFVFKRFTADQSALVALAKLAKKTGVSAAEADILREWANELGLMFRGPEAHPGRGFGALPHIHLGPIDHIPFHP